MGLAAPLTGLKSPKAVGISSTATINKGPTGLSAIGPGTVVPAQGVSSTGAFIQGQRTGVTGIPGHFRVLVLLHRILRVLRVLIILRGPLGFLLHMRDPQYRHRVQLVVSSVCSITRERS